MKRGFLLHSRPRAAVKHTPSVFGQLPHEILLDIFAYLDPTSLARLSVTCSRIRKVVLQDALWKPFIMNALQHLSPPVRGPNIHPLKTALPMWDPAFGLQADVSHPPSWPKLDEYVQPHSAADASHNEHEPYWGLFPGATSLYQIYVGFIRTAEPLLGWWASNVSYFGMVIRIVIDMHFSYDVEEASPAVKFSSTKRRSPSIVCQRVYLTNRLRGLDSDMQRWSEVAGFPMPSNSSVTDQGTVLCRSSTQVRNDLCEPGIRTEDLWHFSWDDARCHGLVPAGIAQAYTANQDLSFWNQFARQVKRGYIQAHISSESWVRSIDPQEGSAPDFQMTSDGILVLDDDPEEDSSAAFKHLDDAREKGMVRVSSSAYQPYLDVSQPDPVFAGLSRFPSLASQNIFPPPAMLSAIRSPPWSRLDKLQIGVSNIWETMSADHRYLIAGKGLMIDSITMTPPPPHRQWPVEVRLVEEVPRFFPICNPRRTSALPKPLISHSTCPAEAVSPVSLASLPTELSGTQPSSTSTGSIVYHHIKPSPQHDPAHLDFDWDAVEGLYSMPYGPHGMELLYVRARQLTSLDFEADERQTARPLEPLLSDDDIYNETRITRDAVCVGARVLEAVKVLGDRDVHRGRVTWRAFIDDPGRSGVTWRAPPDGFRRHTPWPLRPPLATSSEDVRSPGLVLPAHGRVTGGRYEGEEGGWVPALACISSIDEIQIWWQPMYKISVAKKLIGV